ncbi:MAG: hypothetical protein H7X95_03975, partial [Deltaproteobacteria bacterium]|nr:hypothetical protein [Deltaproteobacteria bacterium]
LMLDNVKRGFALARSEGLQIFEGEFLAAAAQASALGGDVETAATSLEQAALAGANLPSSHLFRAGIFEYSQGLQRFAAGAFEEAAHFLGLATVATQRTSLRWGEILCRVLRCVALDACGRLAEASLEAERMAREIGVESMAVPRLGMQLLAAEVAIRDGDFVSGRRILSSALIEAERDGFGYVAFYARGLPQILAHGLRDPAHAPWLSRQIATQRIRPSAEHLDLDVWPWAFTVRTLNGFELRGASVSATRKVQKAPLRLLKCLIAAGGEPLPTTSACEALWGEEGRTASRRMFDTTLHRLRKLLGDDVVQLTDGALTIDRTRCFVDAWGFLSLADRAERRLRQDTAEAAAGQARALFDQALQLYRGPFLPDEDDVPFAMRFRGRLRTRFVRLVLAFAGTIEPHDWDQAVVLYDRALDTDESAELLTQGLMRGYLARSRSAEALKEYHRCQLALHAAGASPSEETRALYDEARGRTHAPRSN